MAEEPDKIRLEDFAVVYEGYYGSCSQIIEVLTKEGFHPEILEKPDAILTYASAGKYWVHLAVPNEEKLAAKEFLKKWEEKNQADVEQLSFVLAKQFFASFISIIPVALIFYFTGYFVDGFIFLFFIWIGILIFVANKDRIFKKAGGQG
jgi:hypothetical protein